MPDTADSKTKRWRWLLPVVLAVLPPGFVLWLLRAAGDDRLALLGDLLYLWMPIVCIYAGCCFVWRFRSRTTTCVELLTAYWPGIVLAVVATIVVFWLSPGQMRVQFDETSLVGTSQNMHLQRSAILTTGAIPLDGAPLPLENMVDKRPTLFAFLVSVVHDVSGYRLQNAFVVNAMILALGLLLLFVWVRSRLGIAAGLTAPLLVLSVPLTSIVATSAGFELLATVLLLATSIATVSLIDKPSDNRWAAFLGSGMLLAQSRYESVGCFALLFVIAFWCTRGRYRASFRIWTLLALCPVLLMPLFVLLHHAQDPNFTPESAGRELLSWSHFTDHFVPFIRSWFGWHLDNPLPGMLTGAALIVWLARVYQRRVNSVELVAMVPVLQTVLVLAWFYGDVREVTALRLFLPLAWLSLLPLLDLSVTLSKRFRHLPILLLGISVLCCGFRLPYVADQSAFPTLPIASLTGELDKVVARLPGDPATTLWVGVPAQHMIIKGHAAISVATFLRLGQDIARLQRQGDLRTIYLIETPLDRDMAPMFGSSRDVLSRISSQVVERVGGQMPITVHRLGR